MKTFHKNYSILLSILLLKTFYQYFTTFLFILIYLIVQNERFFHNANCFGPI